MAQTKEDLENIKSKLIEHIKSTYDEAKATEFINNINSMNDEQFIEFLKQQGLLGKEGEQNQCIFCSMVSGGVPTTKIGENADAISILELNPVSTGHSLIIPKAHLDSKEKFSEEVKNLTKEISEKLQKTFKPSRIDLVEGNVMGHEIINILPIYGEETINSERKQQTPEGLAELKKQIEQAQPEQIESKKEPIQLTEPTEENKVITEEDMILPKRIP
jgi:histidine triad (HIT) family protein